MDLTQFKKTNKGYLQEETKTKGRKQKYNEPLDQKITFSLTTSEKKKLFSHCEDIGMSISICVRRALKAKDLI